MKKRCFILLILVCFSVTNVTGNSSKNLRILAPIELAFNKAENLVNDNKILKFDIILDGTPDLEESKIYKLTILYKSNKVSASCSYSEEKLSCQYDCNEFYFGSIQLPKSTEALADDEINLKLTSEITLLQNVELNYDETSIEYVATSPTHYVFQIKLKETTDLQDGAIYQVDIIKNGNNEIADFTYTSSTKSINCEIKGGVNDLIKIPKEKIKGSVSWVYEGTEEEFEKMQLLKFKVTFISGYDLDYSSNKWIFKIKESSTNVHKEGYYFTINTILKKESQDVHALAICSTTSQVYVQTCEVEKIIEPSTSSQDSSDLVCLSDNQEGASISVSDNSLAPKTLIPRLISLTFNKAYDLKFENSKWYFKIKIDNEGLRNGLNVTVDLIWEDQSNIGNCVHEDKILTCVRNKYQGQQEDELIYLSFTKKVGSVTWTNKNEQEDDKIKIPLEAQLTHVASYYLKYENEKWTFKIDFKPKVHVIAKGSIITVDIFYDSDKKTTATCDLKVRAQLGYVSTFSCECNLDSNIKNLQLINKETESGGETESGTIDWDGYTEPYPIEKKIEFKFVKSYNLKFVQSPLTWSFDIDFEDPKELNPQPSQSYSVDISYTDGGTRYYDTTAACNLKQKDILTFHCEYNPSTTKNLAQKYILYMRTTKTVNPKTINWIEGISDYNQMITNIELIFKKGTLEYNNNWILEIEVDIPENVELLDKSKVIIGLNKIDLSEQTIECIASSTNLLTCDTNIKGESADILPSYTLKKDSTSSSVIWTNTETDNKFYYFYLVTNLDFNSADNLIFSTENQKWKFNLDTSEFPDKSIIIIDILKNDASSTSTCIKESTISCEINEGTQDKTPLIKINHIKSDLSTITWNNLSENKDVSIPIEKDNPKNNNNDDDNNNNNNNNNCLLLILIILALIFSLCFFIILKIFN